MNNVSVIKPILNPSNRLKEFVDMLGYLQLMNTKIHLIILKYQNLKN